VTGWSRSATISATALVWPTRSTLGCSQSSPDAETVLATLDRNAGKVLPDDS